MSNPNADRIAALSRQVGSPEAEVIASVASQYLVYAQHEDDESIAADLTIGFAHDWLDALGDFYEPNDSQQERGIALQNLLVNKATPASQPYPLYRSPLMRLLVAVASGSDVNPNPTPAFGSL